MNTKTDQTYSLVLLVLLVASCSNQNFESNTPRNATAQGSPRPVVGSDATIQYSPEPEASPSPSGTPVATATPTASVSANATPTPVPTAPKPFELTSGIPTLNVPLSKVQITMTIDHVTDIVISNTELFAVHHELAIPTIGSIILYDQAGNVIDTQSWKPDWGSCPTHPTYDANCASTRLKLNAGHVMRGTAIKKSGRGDLLKMSTDPFTVRILDCGKDCSDYGGKGKGLSSTDTYVWTME